MTIDDLLSRFARVRPEKPGQWNAQCPGHDDAKNSLAVSVTHDGTILMKCQAGCSTADMLAAKGLSMRDLFPAKAGRNGKRIVAEYSYVDECGTLLYQAVRMDPKDFRQRSPDGNGGWKWKLNGARRVLYRLPELLAADPSLVVFVAEGEKDCNSLAALDLVATCNVGGAGKWRGEYGEHLAGRKVVILPDNDEPGRKHARQVAASLTGKAASVKVLELSGLPEKGDVSDWLAAGGIKERLLAMVDEGPEWKPNATDGAGDSCNKSKRQKYTPLPFQIVQDLTDMFSGESRHGTG